MKVAVTSRSFSKNTFLKEKLLAKYPESYFNEKGQNFSSDELIDFLRPAQAAIIALEKIDQDILEALPQLKTMSKYGVSLRDGLWAPQFGHNLTNKKIGILGLGHVGKELVKLLGPFQCEISCTEIKPDDEFIKAHHLNLVPLEKLFSENDIVSVHIPLDKNNHLLINDRLLSLMPAHSILINTARGGLVDEDSLFEKLTHKKILAAGFDVFLKEPCSKTELLSLPHFYSTPHIGGSSIESIQAMGLAAIEGLSEAKLIL